jgi:hypothetical protein
MLESQNLPEYQLSYSDTKRWFGVVKTEPLTQMLTAVMDYCASVKC